MHLNYDLACMSNYLKTLYPSLNSITGTESQPSSEDMEPGWRCKQPEYVVRQCAACPVLLNPPTPPAAPPKPLGQPLSLRSFLRPTVGDLVLQADAYGRTPLFMLWGGGELEFITLVPQRMDREKTHSQEQTCVKRHACKKVAV